MNLHRRSTFAAAAVAASLIGLAPPAAASDAAGGVWKQTVDLGTLPGGHSSFALAANDVGQVIGYADTDTTVGDQQHGFFWDKGVMTDLGLMMDYVTPAAGPRAINNLGQVIGSTQINQGTPQGWVWHHGQMTSLGSASPQAINNMGQVVGSFDTGTGQVHAFLWQDGVLTDLGAGGGSYAAAQFINDRGEIVGSFGYDPPRVFTWRNGVMTVLPTLDGDAAWAAGINDLGDVAGTSQTATGDVHPFLWHKGVMTDLGAPATATYTTATGLGRQDDVVGYGSGPELNPTPFIWQHGKMTDFLPADQSAYWQFVNDREQVAGSEFDPFGNTRAYVWQQGRLAYLPSLGVPGADQVSDITNQGLVVGTSRDATGNLHATAWVTAAPLPT